MCASKELSKKINTRLHRPNGQWWWTNRNCVRTSSTFSRKRFYREDLSISYGSRSHRTGAFHACESWAPCIRPPKMMYKITVIIWKMYTNLCEIKLIDGMMQTVRIAFTVHLEFQKWRFFPADDQCWWRWITKNRLWRMASIMMSKNYGNRMYHDLNSCET